MPGLNNFALHSRKSVDIIYDFANIEKKAQIEYTLEQQEEGLFLVPYKNADQVVLPYSAINLNGDPHGNVTFTGGDYGTGFRRLTFPGFYQDNVEVGSLSTGPGQNFYFMTGGWSNYYYVFQSSILIARINNSPVINNYNVLPGDIQSVDLSLSRGTEAGSWSFLQKRNVNGQWVNAISNVDYELVSGTFLDLVFSFKFLVSAEFRLNLKITGYTSFNNPFSARPNGPNEVIYVTDNEASSYVNFNSGVPQVLEDIIFPKINVDVSSFDSISNNPLTIYSGVNLITTSTIDYSSGTWTVDGNPIIVTYQEWLAEMILKCNFNLHVTNKTTGAPVITPREGLGPHMITINPQGEYLFKFITSLK